MIPIILVIIFLPLIWLIADGVLSGIFLLALKALVDFVGWVEKIAGKIKRLI